MRRLESILNTGDGWSFIQEADRQWHSGQRGWAVEFEQHRPDLLHHWSRVALLITWRPRFRLRSSGGPGSTYCMTLATGRRPSSARRGQHAGRRCPPGPSVMQFCWTAGRPSAPQHRPQAAELPASHLRADRVRASEEKRVRDQAGEPPLVRRRTRRPDTSQRQVLLLVRAGPSCVRGWTASRAAGSPTGRCTISRTSGTPPREA